MADYRPLFFAYAYYLENRCNRPDYPPPPDWTIPGYNLDYTLGIVWEIPEYTPQAQAIPHQI